MYFFTIFAGCPVFYLPRIGDWDFLAGLGASPGFLFSANRGLAPGG